MNHFLSAEKNCQKPTEGGQHPIVKNFLRIFLTLVFGIPSFAQQTFSTFQPAELLIGQTAFSANIAACSTGRTRGPSYCSISSRGVLAIVDQSGHRVNIWKNPYNSNFQVPDVVVGAPNFSTCASSISQSRVSGPNGVAFSPDGQKLLVCDYANNRVLIWTSIPDTNGTPANIVIGQSSFTSGLSSVSQTGLNGPLGIFVAPNGKLLVADGNNHRVLIWNSIPTQNNQPADVVLGQLNFSSNLSGISANKFNLPWGIWVAPNGKLLVADVDNHRVLVWNTIPTENGKNADVVIGQSTFTSRTARVSQSGLNLPVGVTVSPGGKLAIGEFGNSRVLLFDSIPTTNFAPANQVLGQQTFTTSTSFFPSGTPTSQNMSRVYNVSFDLYGRLFVVGRDMNRGLIFGTFPTKNAELEIKMRATNTVVCAASPTTAIISIKNNGPDSATNVISTASLPATFLYNSHLSTVGSYNPVSGFWNIPFIPPGDSVLLSIDGNSASSGTFSAFANIIQSNQIDSNFANNGTSIIYNAQEALNCITTGPIKKAVCMGSVVKVPFLKAGNFLSTSVFTAELSDKNGGFVSPQAIGSFTGLSSDTILATIPGNIPVGNNYRIRVNCDNPIVFGQANTDDIVIDNQDSIANRIPVLTNQARFLQASLGPIKSEYEWRRNGTTVSGLTTRKIYAQLAGSYTVAFNSGCGTSPFSSPFVFNVNSQPQSITFPTIPAKIFTDSKFKIGATASSGLPISFSVSGPVFLSNDSLKITGVGAVTVLARQGGNLVFDTAANQTQSFVISPAPQTITFNPIADRVFGNNNFTLQAQSSSGLPVTFEVISGPAFVSGLNFMVILGVGTVTVRASQIGNANFLAAAPQIQSFCVIPGKPDLISGPISSCTNVESTYSISTPENASAVWSISPTTAFTQVGDDINVSFATPGTYTLTVKFNGICGNSDSTRTLKVTAIDQNPFTTAVFNLLPANGNSNVVLPVNLSWFPINGADFYDVYLWQSTLSEPVTPTFANLTSINISVTNSILQFGKTYLWKVVAKKACFTLISPIQSFTVRQLPDLVVQSIVVPATGFSGQNASIEWTVKNNGLGGTLSQIWTDFVYISLDPVFSIGTDFLLGQVQNFSALNPGQVYTQTRSFLLPNGFQDNFFVFVVTNSNGSLLETTTTNNTSVSNSPIAITLTPPPDLRVTSIVSNNFAFSSQPINYSWKVKNLGTGPTLSGSWSERVYLTQNGEGDLSNAINLGTFSHSGALAVNQEYTVSKTIVLPQGISGKYFLYVTTDIYNQIYEHSLESNNTFRGDTITILLTPPPDLVPSNLVFPNESSLNVNTLFSYSVTNEGGTETPTNSWVDQIYISKLGFFNPDSSILLGSISRTNKLQPGDDYLVSLNLKIPNYISGNYFFYVATDNTKRVFEGEFETNNIIRSTGTILLKAPDLRAKSVIISNADTAGKSIPVSWVVRNNGPGNLIDRTLKEKIYISQNPVFANNSITGLKEISQFVSNISSGDSLIRTTNVLLPEGLNGTYFLYVHVDFLSEIYENNLEINNISRSNGIQLIPGPTPDLRVIQVSRFVDSIRAGSNLQISYKVENRGARSTKVSSWSDQVYISTNPVFDSTTSTKLKVFVRSATLAKDSGYVVNGLVSIPGELAGGNYFLFVLTDFKNQVFELPSEANNTGKSASFFVKEYPPVDLAVTEFSVPPEAFSGQAISVAWRVANVGGAPTLLNSWKDALYLSTDTIYSAGTDILVGSVVRSGSLVPGAGYSRTQNFTVPNGLSGRYYLMMVSDYENLNNDAFLRNNVRKLQTGGDSAKINITLTLPVDLVVTSISKPDEVSAGQPLVVDYTVKNQGPGSIPSNKSWSDHLVLSTDLVFGNGDDRFIASTSRSGALGTNQSYSNTLSGIIPINFIGNYIVFLVTDRNNSIYEHEAEGNNSLFSPISVAAQLVSDLVVEDISAPFQAIPGDPINISWKVKNIGVNNAIGQFKDAVYLSLDTIKSNDDILIGSTTRTNNFIPPGGFSIFSLSNTLTGITENQYHILVQVDIQENILESNNDNNVGSSAELMDVSVEELVLGVEKSKQLLNNLDQFYKIAVPDSLESESLLTTIEGDSINGDNELYLRFGTIPTRANFDFSHGNAFGGNQEAIVDQLQSGTYYLLAGGKKINGTFQDVKLLARKLNFEIRSVNSNKGGNSGRITFQLKGAKFSTVKKIRLKRDSGIFTSDSINIINPTTLFVTFNLNDAPLGVYDVTAINEANDSTTLANSFTIEAANNSLVAGNVFAPSNSRLNSAAIIRVEFSNPGNTDIVNPQLIIRSLGGSPISLSPIVSPSGGASEIAISVEEANGLPGILRPGASGTVFVYADTKANLSFFLSNN